MVRGSTDQKERRADTPPADVPRRPGLVPPRGRRSPSLGPRASPRLPLPCYCPRHRSGTIPLAVPPLSQDGHVTGIAVKLGGSERLVKAVQRLQALLYAA
jgi:hypothetical protein